VDDPIPHLPDKIREDGAKTIETMSIRQRLSPILKMRIDWRGFIRIIFVIVSPRPTGLPNFNQGSGNAVAVLIHHAAFNNNDVTCYLKDKAPDYKIDLKHDLSRNIQADIQKGLIDIGIVINPTEVPDIVIQKLAIDTVQIWSAKGNKEHDTVICNLNLFQTQSILKKWKNKPKRIISTDSLELISRLTNEKIGLTHSAFCILIANIYISRVLIISSTTLGSANVDISPKLDNSFSAILRKIRRMIFPERVFGNPLTQ
jgi:hypothetical protein